MSNRYFPKGVLKRVTREAYQAVLSMPGVGRMTPAEREAEAVAYDKMFKLKSNKR